MALRVWFEHRESAELPPWRSVALEVVAQAEHRMRDEPVLAPAGGWQPF
jgi:hypothetical protein